MNLRLRHGTKDVPLEQGACLIGRSPDCHVVLMSHRVSRQHARVTVSPTGVHVEDLGSKNGTFINGVQVEGIARLEVGDHLIIASCDLELVQHDGPGRDETSDDLKPLDQRPPDSQQEPLSGPASEPSADSATRKDDAFAVMGLLADRLLAIGQRDQAEKVLAPRLHTLLRGAKATGQVAADADQVARLALKLARVMQKAQWVDYMFDLYTIVARPLPADVVEQLYSVVREVPPIRLELLRAYVDALEREPDRWGPRERFVVSRIRGLHGLAAAR